MASFLERKVGRPLRRAAMRALAGKSFDHQRHAIGPVEAMILAATREASATSDPLAPNSAAVEFALVENNPTAFLIVNRIAAEAAIVPFHVIAPDGSPDWNHPITKLLGQMDRELGCWDAVYQMAISLQVTGDAYFRRIDGARFAPGRLSGNNRPSRVNVPQELKFLSPIDVTFDLDTAEDRIRRYHYSGGIGMIPIEPDEMVHIRYRWPTSRHKGLSVLRSLHRQLRGSTNLKQIVNDLIDKGAVPPAILALEEDQDEVDDDAFVEMRENMKEFRRGGDRAGEMALLRGRYKMHSTPPVVHLTSIEQDNHYDSQIANGFGYPPILLRSGEAVSYENQEHAELALWERTIIPKILRPAASVFSANLGVDIGFDLSETPIAKAKSRSAWERQGQVSEILTVDERRTLVGYDPLDAGGEVIFRAATEIPYSSETGQPIEAPSALEDGSEITRLIEDYLANEREAKSLCNHDVPLIEHDD